MLGRRGAGSIVRDPSRKFLLDARVETAEGDCERSDQRDMLPRAFRSVVVFIVRP